MRLCDKNNNTDMLDTTTYGIVGVGLAAARISGATAASSLPVVATTSSSSTSHFTCQDGFWKETATSECRFYDNYEEVAKEDESSSSDEEEEDGTCTPRSSGQTWNDSLPVESRAPESTAPMHYQHRRRHHHHHHHRQFFSHLLPISRSSGRPSVDDGFIYRGIAANPPTITLEGVTRGNVAQIHRKAWLEVSDEKHRYGKNLRLYYRHWESLGYPSHNFFDWLDSKGAAAGQPLPSLPDCPRSVLDSDTVLYISDPEVTRQYALVLEPCEGGRCRVLHAGSDGQPVVSTGPNGWIFVLRDNVFYGAEKVAAKQQAGAAEVESPPSSSRALQRFHHSSFFGGKAVAAAGIFITDDEGRLELLYPHSGHYRPGEADMQRILFFLHRLDIDLSTFQVDTQQLIRVNRHQHKHQQNQEGAKKSHNSKTSSNNNEHLSTATTKHKRKKTDSLRLKPAIDVAHYLSHKARFIGGGILTEIEEKSHFHSYIPCHQQRTE